MKILSADFVKSCMKPAHYPHERLPEVAFVGRSNVGKSSAINSLLNRKAIAKVSTTPGKTQTLNFFRILTSDKTLPPLFFVDLPGYGYAKAARSVREQWGPMIERYLRQRAELCAVVQLVDVRGVEAHDVTTLEWLTHLGYRPIVVVTKIDKLSRGRRRPALLRVRQTLGVDNHDEVVGYSSKTNEGRQELWNALRARYESWHDPDPG